MLLALAKFLMQVGCPAKKFQGKNAVTSTLEIKNDLGRLS